MFFPKIEPVEKTVSDDNGREWRIIGTMDGELSYYDDMGVFTVDLSIYKQGEWLGVVSRLCAGWIQDCGDYDYDYNDGDETLWREEKEIHLHCHDVESPIPDEIMWEMDEVSARVCDQLEESVRAAKAEEDGEEEDE